MCERCEEEEQRKKIFDSFKNGPQQNACSLQKKDAKLQELMKDEQFNAWYQTIAKMSNQLKECILSSISYTEKMKNLYDELIRLDMMTDKKEIINLLTMIKAYANMAQVNDSVIRSTTEILLEKTVGNH
jgi:hypothetical protein